MLFHSKGPYLLLSLQNRVNCFQMAKQPMTMVSLIQGALIYV